MKRFHTLCLAAFAVTGFSAKAQEFKPNLGPELPAILLKNENLTVMLRQASQWTPGRIDFKGTPMTTERSAYGTVFMFPEIGFIGTGHLENEPEELQSLRFFKDGKEIAEPSEIINGDSLAVLRQSRIRNFAFTNRIELKDERLIETVTVEAAQDTALKLVYHFMHAWKPTVSAYLSGIDGEDVTGEVLKDGVERAFHIETAVDWIAVFDPDSRQYAVSRLLECPAGVKTTSKIWNVPGTYRKYYLQSLYNETVSAGFKGTWKMITAFGSAGAEAWEEKATKLAEQLKP